MGYGPVLLWGKGPLLWGKGELVCTRCMKDRKDEFYRCKLKGRNVYCTPEYYRKYWMGDASVQVTDVPRQRGVSGEA